MPGSSPPGFPLDLGKLKHNQDFKNVTSLRRKKNIYARKIEIKKIFLIHEASQKNNVDKFFHISKFHQRQPRQQKKDERCQNFPRYEQCCDRLHG